MSEAKRLFHGRGQNLNYNIDFIPPFILIDAFEDLGTELLDSLQKEHQEAEGIFYRNRKNRTGFTALKGEIPSHHTLVENGLKYEINLLDNQNRYCPKSDVFTHYLS